MTTEHIYSTLWLFKFLMHFYVVIWELFYLFKPNISLTISYFQYFRMAKWTLTKLNILNHMFCTWMHKNIIFYLSHYVQENALIYTSRLYQFLYLHLSTTIFLSCTRSFYARNLHWLKIYLLHVSSVFRIWKKKPIEI